MSKTYIVAYADINTLEEVININVNEYYDVYEIKHYGDGQFCVIFKDYTKYAHTVYETDIPSPDILPEEMH